MATSKGSIVDFTDELEAAEAELDESSSALLRIAFIATERKKRCFKPDCQITRKANLKKKIKE